MGGGVDGFFLGPELFQDETALQRLTALPGQRAFPLLRHIGRYVAQKLASDPRTREKAAKVASVVVGEAEDRAREAGRAVRRAMNKLQGNR